MPHALILGASRGLGLGLARELVQRGWTVTGTIRKEADRAALEQAGATVATADITDPASIAAWPKAPRSTCCSSTPASPNLPAWTRSTRRASATYS